MNSLWNPTPTTLAIRPTTLPTVVSKEAQDKYEEYMETFRHHIVLLGEPDHTETQPDGAILASWRFPDENRTMLFGVDGKVSSTRTRGIERVSFPPPEGVEPTVWDHANWILNP